MSAMDRERTRLEVCDRPEANVSSMIPYQYVVSLRIWHPSVSHEEISRLVGLQPKYCWTVGSPRLSPKGAPLGGLRESTYWSAALIPDTASSDPTEVEQALVQELEYLTSLTAVFTKIRKEGGKAELFVGLFSENNIVIDMEPSLMGRLSQCGLGICLDYYPWKR